MPRDSLCVYKFDVTGHPSYSDSEDDVKPTPSDRQIGPVLSPVSGWLLEVEMAPDPELDSGLDLGLEVAGLAGRPGSVYSTLV